MEAETRRTRTNQPNKDVETIPGTGGEVGKGLTVMPADV